MERTEWRLAKQDGASSSSSSLVVVHGIQQGPDVIDGRGGVDPPIVLRMMCLSRSSKVASSLCSVAVLAMTVTVHDGSNLTHRRSRGNRPALVLEHKGDRA